MRPIFIVLAAYWAVLLGAAAAAQPTEALKRALEARNAGDWITATDEARLAGPVAQDIIMWHRLRAKEGSFREAQQFLERRSDWPGLPYLRQRSEHAIPEGAPPAQVLNFFAAQLPRTGNGSLRLADALSAAGQDGRVEVVRGWTTLSLSLEEETEFLSRHGRVVADHMVDRVDFLLWRGLTNEAERLLTVLPNDQRALAEARIAVRENRDGLNAVIDAVPAALAGDPGLAYERFLWRANRGRTDDAIALLESTENLGEPERWGNLRRRYARMLMRAGENRRAYRIASNHGLTEGSHFADLEWLSGYLALRKLGDADTALRHFERMEAAVDTPISLARGQYWQGRAHAFVRNTSAAAEDYGRAARHQTAFYGLLAAEEAGLPMDQSLTGREAFPDWRTAPFVGSSVYEAAILLLAAGDLNLGERFLTHLTESLDRAQMGQLARMAEEMGQPHLQVMIAKRAVQYGQVIEGPYYALHPLANETGSVAPELALAIARRESEFDPAVTSGVGARGLMQLMLPTAKEMAGDMGIAFEPARLLSDPIYNARLGLTYLTELQTTFGNSPVLIAAAYNAGPSRANRWMEERGDPRTGRTGRLDIVDWIEHIPFRETRNYVMRVTESLPVYRARLSGQVEPLRFKAELRGVRPTGAQLRAIALPPPPPSAVAVSLRPQMRPAVRATE